MWPWEHLAIGYVVVSVTWRLADRELDGWTAAAVASSTLFPDVVDKPLAWSLGVLPAGRSLAHSLFVAVPVTSLFLVLAARRNRTAMGIAFCLGYYTHLLGDVIPRVLSGYYRGASFLFWPLLEVPPRAPGVRPALERLQTLLASPELYVSTGFHRVFLVLAMVAIWSVDGFPGVADFLRYCRRAATSD